MEKSQKLLDYREVLRTEFINRKQKDPFYTLSKFADELKLSVQHLSYIFKGKRGVSGQKANSIANAIGLSPLERQSFVFLVASQSGRSLSKRRLGMQGLKRKPLAKANNVLKIKSQNGLAALPPISKKLELQPR